MPDTDFVPSKPPPETRLADFLQKENLVLDARVQTVQVADGSALVRAVVVVKEAAGKNS